MAAVGPIWFEWKDAESGESFGESTLLAVARKLAREIATKPLIDKRRHSVELLQQPGSRLLQRFRPDGSIDEIAELLILEPESGERQWGVGAPGIPGAALAVDGEAVLRLNEHGARRVVLERAAKAAGLPDEAAWVRYAVLVETDKVIFFDADFTAVLDKAQQLSEVGRPVEVYNSRGWVRIYPVDAQ